MKRLQRAIHRAITGHTYQPMRRYLDDDDGAEVLCRACVMAAHRADAQDAARRIGGGGW